MSLISSRSSRNHPFARLVRGTISRPRAYLELIKSYPEGDPVVVDNAISAFKGCCGIIDPACPDFLLNFESATRVGKLLRSVRAVDVEDLEEKKLNVASWLAAALDCDSRPEIPVVILLQATLLIAENLANKPKTINAAITKLNFAQRLLDGFESGSRSAYEDANNLFSQVAEHVVLQACSGRLAGAWGAFNKDQERKAYEWTTELHSKLSFLRRCDPDIVRIPLVLLDQLFVLQSYFALKCDPAAVVKLPVSAFDRIHGEENRLLGGLLRTCAGIQFESFNGSVLREATKSENDFFLSFLRIAGVRSLFMGSSLILGLGEGYLRCKQLEHATVYLEMARSGLLKANNSGLDSRVSRLSIPQCLFSLGQVYYSRADFRACLSSLAQFSVVANRGHYLAAQVEFALGFLKHSLYMRDVYCKDPSIKKSDHASLKEWKEAENINPVFRASRLDRRDLSSGLRLEAEVHFQNAERVAKNVHLIARAQDSLERLREDLPLKISYPFHS